MYLYDWFCGHILGLVFMDLILNMYFDTTSQTFGMIMSFFVCLMFLKEVSSAHQGCIYLISVNLENKKVSVSTKILLFSTLIIIRNVS